MENIVFLLFKKQKQKKKVPYAHLTSEYYGNYSSVKGTQMSIFQNC